MSTGAGSRIAPRSRPIRGTPASASHEVGQQLQATLGLNKHEIKDLGYKSGDLAIVVSKPWPWDGKFTAR